MKTVAIIGASGIVGRETINVLYNRQFPIKELKLYSSIRSSGKKSQHHSKSSYYKSSCNFCNN